MQRLRFLHIPKTAGSTFNGVLLRQCHGQNHFHFSSDEEMDRDRYNALPEMKKQRLALFTGHAGFMTGIQKRMKHGSSPFSEIQLVG